MMRFGRWSRLQSERRVANGRDRASVGDFRRVVRKREMKAAVMDPVIANLGKLRSLLSESWKIDSLNMQALSSSSWRTTVTLKRAKRALILHSEDREFFDFCVSMRPSLDETGDPVFRQIADLDRYYEELRYLKEDSERKRMEGVQRCASGQVRLDFAPEPLIAEFLTSRKWGDTRYLQLKKQYFDIFAVLLFLSKSAVEAQERLQVKFPRSTVFSKRIGEVLLRAFEPTVDPLKNYLRFAEANRVGFPDIAAKLLDQGRFNDDTFARLAANGGAVRGDIGLHNLINMYGQYVNWASSLLRVLSDAVCTVGGRPIPESSRGITSRVDLIRGSGYSDIVDCLDPRIRHSASHDGIEFDQGRSVVRFCGIDSNGNRKFDDFELSYVQASDKIRDFTQGFIPGIFIAFGMQQQLHLLSAVESEEYLNLLLLIDNEVAE
jgi:hypothetical protein